MDIILKRAEQGLCPICKKPLDESKLGRYIEYNGERIAVCAGHEGV